MMRILELSTSPLSVMTNKIVFLMKNSQRLSNLCPKRLSAASAVSVSIQSISWTVMLRLPNFQGG